MGVNPVDNSAGEARHDRVTPDQSRTPGHT